MRKFSRSSIFPALALALLLLGTRLMFFAATAEKGDLQVTVAPNPWLDVEFHRKERTKKEGWKIYLRMTNKTKKAIEGIHMSYDVFEGDWRIGYSSYSSGTSSGLLKAGTRDVFGWMENIPSSATRIHIYSIKADTLPKSKSTSTVRD